MIKEGVVAFIGPDESCLYEALVASAWNLPMISYVSLMRGRQFIQWIIFSINENVFDRYFIVGYSNP